MWVLCVRPGQAEIPFRLAQAAIAQTALPVPLHAQGRVLQSMDDTTGVDVSAGWNVSDWQPQLQPGQGALAAIPLKPAVKASSTKAVALQHLKVRTPAMAPCELMAPWQSESCVVAQPCHLPVRALDSSCEGCWG